MRWHAVFDNLEDHLIQTERGERVFAEGDSVYFLQNDRLMDVKNGTLGTIVDIDAHSLKVEIHQGNAEPQIVTLDLNRYNHLDYDYAATIHKSQGSTVDQTFILASPYLDRHATYVAMTRHSDHAELFWSKEAFPSYEAMVDTLSRDRSKEFSLDYTAEEFALHRGIESEALLTLESYHRELNSKEDFVLDWEARRRDVEENNPELAREMTQHVIEDPRLDLALENKPDDGKPDWYHTLFNGLDKNDDSRDDFLSKLFYGREDVLRRNAEGHLEVSKEMEPQMTETPERDLALENKLDDDKPDWYHTLFNGLDKKDESKDDFLRQLFYGREDELAKIEREPLGKDISDDHEIGF